MPSFADIAQSVLNKQGGGASVPSGGSGNSFVDLYNAVRDQNGGGGAFSSAAAQQYLNPNNQESWLFQNSQARNDQSMFSSPWEKQEQEREQANKENENNPDKRQAAWWENMIHTAAQFGQAMTPHFSTNNPVLDTIANVGVGATTGTVLAPLSGNQSLYEAGTGADIQSIDENGWMNSQQLKPEQRFGAGVSGLIDTVGLAAGGSARALGGGVNLVRNISRAEKGLDAPKSVWKGLVVDSDNPKINIATDMAEEGGEEFVQSLADDVRNEQFDSLFGESGLRALEAGGIGAAAGGVMSAGGMLMNQAGNRIAERSQTRRKELEGNNVVTQSAPAPSFADLNNGFTQENEVPTITPSGREALDEKVRDYHADRPASTMARNSGTLGSTTYFQPNGTFEYIKDENGDDYHDSYNEFGLGDQNIKAMWEQAEHAQDAQGNAKPGQVTRQVMLDEFGVATEDEFNQMLYKNGKNGDIREDFAENITKSLMARRHSNPSQWIIGRNPATNPDTGYKQNLVAVFPGSGYRSHMGTFTRVSMDNDGDISPAMAVTPEIAKSYSYPTERIYHRNNGSRLSFNDYSGISPDIDDAVIENAVEQTYGQYLPQETITELKTNFKKAINSGDKIDDDLLAQTLDMASSEVQRTNPQQASQAHVLADQVLTTIQYDQRNLLIARMGKVNNSTVEEMHQDFDECVSYVPGAEWMTKGTTAGKTRPVEFFDMFAHFIVAVSGSTNPEFRKAGQLGLWTKAVHTYVVKIRDTFADLTPEQQESAFEVLMRFAFKYNERGEMPLNNIEGVIVSLIRDSVLNDPMFQNGNKLTTEEDVAAFKEMFVRHWNYWIDMYHDARKRMTSRGQIDPEYGPTKSKLEGVKDKALNSDMLDVLGDVRIDALFETDNESQVFTDNPTIREYCRQRADNPRQRTYGQAINRNTRNFMNSLYSAYRTRRNGIVATIRNILKENRDTLQAMYKRYQQNGNKLDPRDKVTMLSWLDGFDTYMDAKILLDFDPRLIDVEHFFDTEYGQIMATDRTKNAERSVVALMSLGYRASFQRARELWEAYQNLDVRRKQAYGADYLVDLTNELTQQAQVSPVRNFLATLILQGIEDGKKNPFDYVDILTNLQNEADIKTRTEWIKNNWPDAPSDIDLLVDALTTENTEFSESSVSARMRNGYSIQKRAHDTLLENIQRSHQVWKSAIETGQIKRENLPIIFQDLLNTAEDEIDSTVAGMVAYDGTGINNHDVEKNVTSINAAAYYQMLAMETNGGLYSAQEIMTAISLGRCPLDMVISNRVLMLRFFQDPSFEIEVYDPNNPGRRADMIMSRETIMKACGRDVSPEQTLTADDVLALFNHYPQFLSWLSPQKTTVYMSNGEYTVRQGMIKQPVDAWVDRQTALTSIGRDTDPARQHLITTMVREVSKVLQNNPTYRKYQIHYIAAKRGINGDITHILTPQQLIKEMREADREIAEFFLRSVLSSNEMKGQETLHKVQQGRAVTLINDLAKAFSDARFLQEQLATIDNAAAREVQREIKNSLGTAVMNDALLDVMSEYGLSVPGVTESENLPESVRGAISNIENSFKAQLDTLLQIIAITIDSSNDITRSGNQMIFGSLGMNIDEVAEAVDQATELTDPQTKKVYRRDSSDPLEKDAYDRLKAELVQKVKQQSDSIINQVSTLISEENGLALFSTDLKSDKNGNIDPASAVAIVDKIEQIEDTLQMRQEERIDRNKVLSKLTGNDAVRYFNELRIEWNTLYTAYLIRDMRLRTGFNMNHEIVKDYVECQRFERDMFDAVKAELKRQHGGLVDQLDIQTDERIQDMPTEIPLDFSNQETNEIANRTASLTNEGMIPSSIGINGQKADTYSSFAWIPSNFICTIPPRPITGAQIKSNPKRYLGAHYIKPGDTYSPDPSERDTWSMLTITADNIMTLNDTDTLEVFEPNENPGWCSCHANEHLRGDVGHMNDVSQEDMVLQIKKYITLAKEIVVPFKFESKPSERKFSIGKCVNKAILLIQARRKIQQYRKRVSDYYMRAFASERNKKYNLDRSTADALAAAQFSALTFLNDQGQSVTMSYVDILNAPDLQPVLDQLGTVTTIEIRMQTLEEIAARIDQAVYIAWMQHSGGDINDLPSMNEIHDAVYDAVYGGWEKYNPDQLGVDAVMAEMAPRTENGTTASTLVSENSPTRVQNLDGMMIEAITGTDPYDFQYPSRDFYNKDSVFEGSERHMIESANSDFSSAVHDPDGSPNSTLENWLYRNRAIGESVHNNTIVATFYDGSPQADLTGGPDQTEINTFFWSLLRLKPQNKRFADGGENWGIVLSNSPDQFEKAVNWARKTGGSIMIPAAYYENMRNNKPLGMSDVLWEPTNEDHLQLDMYDNVGHSSKEDFVLLHYKRGDNSKWLRNRNPKVPLIDQDPNKIVGVACIPRAQADGAGLISARTASYFREIGYRQIKLNTQGVLPAKGSQGSPVHIATKQEILDTFGNYATQNGIKTIRTADLKFLDKTHLDEMDKQHEVLDGAIQDYLLALTSDEFDDDNHPIRKTDVKRGQVVGFLARKYDDGIRLWPIFTPQSGIWDKMDSVDVIHKNGTDEFYFEWSSTGSLTDINGAPIYDEKDASMGVSNKRTIRVMHGEFPKAGKMNKFGVGAEIGEIDSAETVVSRANGAWTKFTIGNIFYYTCKTGRSAFFDVEGDKIKLNEHIRKQFVSIDPNTGVEVFDAAGLYALFHNDKKTFDMVRDGQITIFEDAEANRIVQDIIRAHPYDFTAWSLFFNNLVFTDDQMEELCRTGETSFSGKLAINSKSFRFEPFLGDFNADDARILYHAFDENLCYRDANDAATKRPVLFDMDGMFNLNIGVNQDVRDALKKEFGIDNPGTSVVVDWHPQESIGKTTYDSEPTPTAKLSMSSVRRVGLERGAAGVEYKRLIHDAIRRANVMRYQLAKNEAVRPREIGTDDTIKSLDEQNEEIPWAEAHHITYMDRKRIEDIDKIGQTFIPGNMEVMDDNKKVVGDIMASKDPALEPLQQAVHTLREKLGDEQGKIIDHNFIVWMYCYFNGATYNTTAAGKAAGNNRIYVRNLHTAVSNTIKLIDQEQRNGEKHLLIKAKNDADERISVPLVVGEFLERLWQLPFFNQHYQTIDDFRQAMIEEAQRSARQIYQKNRPENAKIKMEQFFEYVQKESGTDEVITVPNRATVVTVDTEELDPIAEQLLEDSDNPDQRAAMEFWMKESRDQMDKLTRLDNRLNSKNIDNSYVTGGKERRFTKQKRGLHKFIDAVVNILKINKIASLEMSLATIAARWPTQASQRFMFWLGRKLNDTLPNNPWNVGNGYVIPNEVLDRVNDDDAELFTELVNLNYTGQLDQILLNVASRDDLDNALREYEANQGKFFKASKTLFWFFTGGNVGRKSQLKIFLQNFAIFAHQEGHDYWFDKVEYTIVDKDGNHVQKTGTMLDSVIETQGIDGFLIQVLKNQNNPDLGIALKSFNISQRMDFSQDTVPSIVFDYLCQKHPVFKLFSATCLSPFYKYAFSITGYQLGTFMPTSTLHYLMQKVMSNVNWAETFGEHFAWLDDLNFDKAMLNTSLKQALFDDLIRLGVVNVAAIIAATAGAIQPPEDDDKKSNPAEYTFLGMRISEQWWLQDLLGMALPLMTFWKSQIDGHPNFSLILNGILETCYSNPVFRLQDLLDSLVDPDAMSFHDYEAEAAQYEDAPGGAPDYKTWLFANATSSVLSWTTQFYTPSLVREVYNMLNPWEASYKRVWQENASGNLTEAGEEGATQQTDFFDAQMRQVTRRSPALGLVFDLLLQPNTGYLNHEMPPVGYYEPLEVTSAKHFAVKDEDGNMLPAQEQEAHIMEAITIMQSTDNMEDLYHRGFYLNYDTRAAISQTVWDIVQQLGEMKDALVQEGIMDYKSDYYDGVDNAYQIVQGLYSEYKKEVQYWKDFYYDKLRSEWIDRDMTMYHRYSTTYSVDSAGEVYATGIYRLPFSGFSPVSWAPGTLDNPEGTAGWGGDWNSLSATVTNDQGQPISLGQRGLVPVNASQNAYNKLPSDLEAWAGEDGKYSNRYKELGYTTDGYLNNLTNQNSDGNANNKSGYPSSYGGRRSYGYSRRSGGGGGGGGGAPNIYSRVSVPYPSSPKTSSSHRYTDANFDYLRPGFETKGSRESSRRSDF